MPFFPRTSVVVLALADIYRGEADVSSEWMVVRFAFGISIAFHIAALTAMSRLRP